MAAWGWISILGPLVALLGIAGLITVMSILVHRSGNEVVRQGGTVRVRLSMKEVEVEVAGQKPAVPDDRSPVERVN